MVVAGVRLGESVSAVVTAGWRLRSLTEAFLFPYRRGDPYLVYRLANADVDVHDANVVTLQLHLLFHARVHVAIDQQSQLADDP